MSRCSSHLLFCLAAVAFVKGSSFADDVHDLEIHEEFRPFQPNTLDGAKNKQFLRRNLQNAAGNSQVCSPADDPRLTWLCIESGMHQSNCAASTETCDSLPDYPCNCITAGNIFQSTCSYCRVEMLTGIICQKTGSRLTFTDRSNKLTTCACEDTGNGVARQICNTPSPRPSSLPTFAPVTSASLLSPTVPPHVVPPTATGTIVQNSPPTTSPVATQTSVTQTIVTQTSVTQTGVTQTDVPVLPPTVRPVITPTITGTIVQNPPATTQTGITQTGVTQTIRPPTMIPIPPSPALSQSSVRPAISSTTSLTGQKSTFGSKSNKNIKTSKKARTIDATFRELP